MDSSTPTPAPGPLWTRERLLAVADAAEAAGDEVVVTVNGQEHVYTPAAVRMALDISVAAA